MIENTERNFAGWTSHCTSSEEGISSIPGRRTKISQDVRHGQNKYINKSYLPKKKVDKVLKHLLSADLRLKT